MATTQAQPVDGGAAAARPPAAGVAWYIRAKYLPIRAGLVALLKFLGLGGLYAFGAVFGWCEYLLQYNRRGRIYRRLDQIFSPPLPASEKRRIARRFFQRVRCDKMIYTIMDHLDPREILRRLEFEGREHLDRAIARGKGTFFMFSHQGSHHLGGLLMTLSGYPLVGLRDPNESPLRLYVQERFARRFPEVQGLEITPSDTFARTYFRLFRENRIVAAAMDISRDRGAVRTVPVTFFGQPAEFLSGMTHIALRCRAVIVIGFVQSLPGYRYRIIVRPPLIDPDTAEDTPEAVQSVMQTYAGIIEDYVRRNPDQISKTK